MANSAIKFDLVSPEALLMSGRVDMVVIPGAEGDFGVLPGHVPMISTLRNGVISTYKDGKVAEKIFVAGGFAEVVGERCTVLAEEAFPVTELDREKIAQKIAHAQEDLRDAKTEDVRDKMKSRLAVLEAKLDAAASS